MAFRCKDRSLAGDQIYCQPLGAPQSGQNFEVMSVFPHAAHVQPLTGAAPQSGQNLDVIPVFPHEAHVQVLVGAAPQSGQNFDVIPVFPQEAHVQPFAAPPSLFQVPRQAAES